MPPLLLKPKNRSPGGSALFTSRQEQMSQLLDQLLTDFLIFDDDYDGGAFFSSRTFPANDALEEKEMIEVIAELLGVENTDLDVTVTEGTLILRRKKSAVHAEAEDDLQFIERRYGIFRRQIPLGFTPEDGADTADSTRGILKLSIEKPPTARPTLQKIDIRKT